MDQSRRLARHNTSPGSRPLRRGDGAGFPRRTDRMRPAGRRVGAGGLSAATTAAWHGLRVVVAEKDRVCGGATAWSGGWAWVPLNPLSQAEGIVEDLDRPRTY